MIVTVRWAGKRHQDGRVNRPTASQKASPNQNSATCPPVVGEDPVEFLGGTKLNGRILDIRKPDKEFDFQTTATGKTIRQTYPDDKVHAVAVGQQSDGTLPKDFGHR